MRMLEKNKRVCHYAYPIEEKSILDEEGNQTLETETVFSDPVGLKVNYSAAAGQEVVEIFGSTTEYSRVLSFGRDCPLKERYILWIGVDPAVHAANYEVRRVADSVNSTLIAVQEIV